MRLLEMVRELSWQTFQSTEETLSTQRIQEQRVVPQGAEVVAQKGALQCFAQIRGHICR